MIRRPRCRLTTDHGHYSRCLRKRGHDGRHFAWNRHGLTWWHA